MSVPSPKDVKVKQAEEQKSKPTFKGKYLAPDEVAKQQADLMKLCIGALGAYKTGVPMIVGTTGFCKKACEYVKHELEESGWIVEKGARDGDFVFIIKEKVESDFD